VAQQSAQLTRSNEEIKVVHAIKEADAETDVDDAALMEEDAINESGC